MDESLLAEEMIGATQKGLLAQDGQQEHQNGDEQGAASQAGCCDRAGRCGKGQKEGRQKVVGWITVAEQFPADREMVIACNNTHDKYRIFAGWLDWDPADGQRHWHEFCPVRQTTLDRGAIRATDYWLSLPVWPPDGPYREVGFYPA